LRTIRFRKRKTEVTPAQPQKRSGSSLIGIQQIRVRIHHGRHKRLDGIDPESIEASLVVRPVNLVFATEINILLPGLQKANDNLAGTDKL
jgi:hypothetical protein